MPPSFVRRESLGKPSPGIRGGKFAKDNMEEKVIGVGLSLSKTWTRKPPASRDKPRSRIPKAWANRRGW
jgi:hypothetical protein